MSRVNSRVKIMIFLVCRRYKTQLRDFLSSCRTKRKTNDIYAETSSFPGYPSPTAYMTGTGTLAGYPPTDTTTLYMQQANIAAAPAYQTLYPGVDNRYRYRYIRMSLIVSKVKIKFVYV